MKLTKFTAYLTAAAIGIGLAQSSLAKTKVQTTLDLPTTVNGVINLQAHRSGPNIIVDTTMNLGSVDLMLLFRKNPKKSPLEIAEFGTNIVLMPGVGQMVMPRSVAKGGVGKKPYIWVQFLDGEGNALTTNIFVGRYKNSKGLKLSPSFMSSIVASLEVEAGDCDKEHKMFYLTGNLILGGVKARFTCKNKPLGKRIASQTLDMMMIAHNSELQVPVKGVHGKLNGNPHISLQFFQGGVPVTEEVELGRCKDL